MSVTDGEVISYQRLKTGFHNNLLHHLFLVFIMENFQTHMKIQDHVIEPMIYLDPRIIYNGANLVPSIPTHLDYLEAKLTYAIISSINTSVYTVSLEENKRITIPSTHLEILKNFLVSNISLIVSKKTFYSVLVGCSKGPYAASQSCLSSIL